MRLTVVLWTVGIAVEEVETTMRIEPSSGSRDDPKSVAPYLPPVVDPEEVSYATRVARLNLRNWKCR